MSSDNENLDEFFPPEADGDEVIYDASEYSNGSRGENETTEEEPSSDRR